MLLVEFLHADDDPGGDQQGLDDRIDIVRRMDEVLSHFILVDAEF